MMMKLLDWLKKAQLNPAFPYRYLMNLVAFKALNDVAKTVPKKLREKFIGQMGNAFLGTGSIKDEMVDFIQNNEKYRKMLPVQDFEEFLKSDYSDWSDVVGNDPSSIQ